MSVREEFLGHYDTVVEPLLQTDEAGLVPVMCRLKEILQYNTAGGKLNRGCAVMHTATVLGVEDTFPPAVLGWCVEILQAFFLVADDIMDNSSLRRGRPCWYKRVGLTAINDALLLESSVFKLLKLHLREKPYYLDCLELFLEVTRRTECGQALDLEAEELALTEYTIERYNSIVANKTAYYSFYLPVALAMHVAGRDTQQELQCARELLLKIGHYFQVQDDYLDCYGDPAVIGKVGTDIQEKKCSWLFITALKHVSEAEKRILFANYGKSEEASVAAVKDLYDSLDIRQKYLDYSCEVYKSVSLDIQNDTSGLPANIFQDFLDKIHKRSK